VDAPGETGETGEKQTRLIGGALARGTAVTNFPGFMKLAATYGKISQLHNQISRYKLVDTN
jgi:hypothetical protein